ncbi:MAG: hypothetical protein ACK4Y9_08280 [Hyphomonas sp.]
MARRRKVYRFRFDGLTPEECDRLLRHIRAPRWMLTRAQRAQTPAEMAALLHPARWPGGRVPFDA